MDVVVSDRVLRGNYDRFGRRVLLMEGINTPGAPVWVGLRLPWRKGWAPLPARPRFAWLVGTLDPRHWKSISGPVVNVQAIIPSARHLPPRIRFRGYGYLAPTGKTGPKDKGEFLLVEPSSRRPPRNVEDRVASARSSAAATVSSGNDYLRKSVRRWPDQVPVGVGGVRC